MLFQNLTDPNSPVFNVAGYPQTLYPESEYLTEEMKSQISLHYMDYHINTVPPWIWLIKFHAYIRQHDYQWYKLIESEKALRDEDGIYNYDLREESSGSQEYESRNNNESEGTTEGFTSDTPDGSLSDIETYMSAGSRSGSEGSSSGTASGSSSGQSSLRRYGNIGVMTSAQILGGYREAVDYNAYDVIWRDLDHLFIGVFDDDLFDGTMYASTENWKGWDA